MGMHSTGIDRFSEVLNFSVTFICSKKEHYTNSKKFLSEMDVDSSPFTTCRFFRN